MEYLRTFLHFDAGTSRVFNYADCAVGNILFAGAYLQHGRDFNRTTAALARLVDSRASLINVTRGENRILAALKEDGELLEREARIVSPQSDARIVGLFLLPAALDADTLARLRRLPLARKRALLRKLERPVDVSDEARECAAASRRDPVWPRDAVLVPAAQLQDPWRGRSHPGQSGLRAGLRGEPGSGP